MVSNEQPSRTCPPLTSSHRVRLQHAGSQVVNKGEAGKDQVGRSHQLVAARWCGVVLEDEERVEVQDDRVARTQVALWMRRAGQRGSMTTPATACSFPAHHPTTAQCTTTCRSHTTPARPAALDPHSVRGRHTHQWQPPPHPPPNTHRKERLDDLFRLCMVLLSLRRTGQYVFAANTSHDEEALRT